MDFELSPTAKELRDKLLAFMDEAVYPAETGVPRSDGRAGRPERTSPRIIEALKVEARAQGLWNLFLPHKTQWTDGLSNLDYAPLAEIMGRSPLASEALQLLGARHRQHGDPHHVRHARAEGAVAPAAARRRDPLGLRHDRARPWRRPTPPTSACAIERDGDEYVLNGRKWWISGAMHPRCKVFIVMGKTDPDAAPHLQQSMVLVPMDTPGVTIVPRRLPVFGYVDRGPLRGDLRGRAGPGDEPARRGGRRLRHRPGPPRARPHPPLHARHRRRRARPRADVPAGAQARRRSASRWPSRA